VIGLPAQLAGRVELAAARPADTVPASASCAGGCRYEIKWDGYRIAIVRTAAAAAEFHLSPGTVLDGEAVVWSDGRLSFDDLQKRLTRRSSKTAPPGPPAHYVAYDLLARDGKDQRRQPYTSLRGQLERLAAKWAPPLEVDCLLRQGAAGGFRVGGRAGGECAAVRGAGS
jgi:ATP-dependent DNA ligase